MLQLQEIQKYHYTHAKVHHMFLKYTGQRSTYVLLQF